MRVCTRLDSGSCPGTVGGKKIVSHFGLTIDGAGYQVRQLSGKGIPSHCDFVYGHVCSIVGSVIRFRSLVWLAVTISVGKAQTKGGIQGYFYSVSIYTVLCCASSRDIAMNECLDELAETN
jgi:hypothetical protein